MGIGSIKCWIWAIWQFSDTYYNGQITTQCPSSDCSGYNLWRIDELLQVIKSKVEARKLSEGVKIGDMRGSDTTYRRNPLSTASALMARDSSSGYCVYYKAEHYSTSYEKMDNVLAQREVLKKEGRCFLCLSNGRHVSQCTTDRQCREVNRWLIFYKSLTGLREHTKLASHGNQTADLSLMVMKCV